MAAPCETSFLFWHSSFSPALVPPNRPDPREPGHRSPAREVPRWPAEEKCFSCHNSGVAAAALFAAVRQGHKIPDKALAETTRWLSQPDKWDGKRDGGTPTDQSLVRIQFGAALAEALDAGAVKERRPLLDAAKLIAAEQRKDGSWQVNAEGTLGSPTTLGPALATHLARGVLRKADAKGHADAVAKADRWLRRVEAKNVPDAAGVLLALEGAEDREAVAQRQRCLELLRKSPGPPRRLGAVCHLRGGAVRHGAGPAGAGPLPEGGGDGGDDRARAGVSDRGAGEGRELAGDDTAGRRRSVTRSARRRPAGHCKRCWRRALPRRAANRVTSP